jgi:hypothetical protein
LLPCFVVGGVAGVFGRRKVEAAWTGFLPPLGFFVSRLPRLRSLANAVLPNYGVIWVALWVIAKDQRRRARHADFLLSDGTKSGRIA